MARPITPTYIRRQRQGGRIEIRSATGYWLPYDTLTTTSRAAVVNRLHAIGCWHEFDKYNLSGQPFQMPLGKDSAPKSDNSRDADDSFDQKDSAESGPTDSGPDSEDHDPRDDDDTADDTDNTDESDDNSDSDSSNNQQQEADMGMEDIVRKIAGEMDEKVSTRIFAELDAKIASVAEQVQQQPAPTNSLVSVITSITVKRPDLPEQTHDDLFHHAFPDLYENCLLGLHSYLPGPPGTGKSHAAEQVAKALGWQFSALSLGPLTTESRLWGGMDANGRFHEPPFVKGCRFAMENPDSGYVSCLDEMDNGNGGIIATLNSTLANGWFYAPNGDRITLGRNVAIVGAANTFGTGPTADFAGRNKLDPATLDRFAYVPWDTDLGMESALVRKILPESDAAAWLDVWRTARKNAKDNGLRVFVTMRGALNGARIIAAGRPMDKALNLVLANKIPSDQWAKINPL